jgi:hypothetical protein
MKQTILLSIVMIFAAAVFLPADASAGFSDVAKAATGVSVAKKKPASGTKALTAATGVGVVEKTAKKTVSKSETCPRCENAADRDGTLDITHSSPTAIASLRSELAAARVEQDRIRKTAPSGIAGKQAEYNKVKFFLNLIKREPLKTNIKALLTYTPAEQTYLNALASVTAQIKRIEKQLRRWNVKSS